MNTHRLDCAALFIACVVSSSCAPREEAPPSGSTTHVDVSTEARGDVVSAADVAGARPTDEDAAEPRDGAEPEDGAEKIAQTVTLRPDPAYPKAPDPADAAWSTAPKLAVARMPSDCEARALGEFVRIECSNVGSSYSEALSGDPRTVKFSHRDAKWSADYSKVVRKPERAVVFPLRPGDRRVVQFADLSGGWRSPWTASTEAVIQAYWLEDEASPTITID